MVYISGGTELLDPLEILKRLGIRVGMKVGDLGCGGAGHFAIPAAQMVGSQGIVYAVDILKSVLKSVVSKGRMLGVNNIRTVWSNLEISEATKIPKSKLDVALLINILFQSKQDDNILKEAFRLVKNGGKILVIDWQPAASSSFGPPPIDRVKPQEVKEIAQKLGLKLIDEFTPGNYHFGLIFQK